MELLCSEHAESAYFAVTTAMALKIDTQYSVPIK